VTTAILPTAGGGFRVADNFSLQNEVSDDCPTNFVTCPGAPARASAASRARPADGHDRPAHGGDDHSPQIVDDDAGGAGAHSLYVPPVTSAKVMHLDATGLPVLDRDAAGGKLLGALWGYVGDADVAAYLYASKYVIAVPANVPGFAGGLPSSTAVRFVSPTAGGYRPTTGDNDHNPYWSGSQLGLQRRPPPPDGHLADGHESNDHDLPNPGYVAGHQVLVDDAL
jgi:hypothetical protein